MAPPVPVPALPSASQRLSSLSSSIESLESLLLHRKGSFHEGRMSRLEESIDAAASLCPPPSAGSATTAAADWSEIARLFSSLPRIGDEPPRAAASTAVTSAAAPTPTPPPPLLVTSLMLEDMEASLSSLSVLSREFDSCLSLTDLSTFQSVLCHRDRLAALLRQAELLKARTASVCQRVDAVTDRYHRVVERLNRAFANAHGTLSALS